MANEGSVLLVISLMMLASASARADCVSDFFSKQSMQHLNPVDTARKMVTDKGYMECTRKGANRSVLVSKPARLDAAMAQTANLEGPLPIPPAWTNEFYFVVRRDFNDIWLFDRRKQVQDLTNVEDAQGAQFSVSSDRIADNVSWNAHAMVAGVYQLVHDRYPSKLDPTAFNFIGFSVAPFAKIDRISNSNPAARVNNLHEVSYGGSMETGFDLLGTSQYFRLRGAGTTDHISRETSGSALLEWTPVVDGILNSPIPLKLPVTFIFGPQMRVRYDNVIVDDATAAKSYLLRVGAAGTLHYRLDTELLPAWMMASGFLAKLSGQTTLSYMHSDTTGKTYSYFDTSLTYNIDDAGHVGLTGSYTKGRSEDTGRRVDLWKAGLTVKW
jgi:hypothetical protein